MDSIEYNYEKGELKSVYFYMDIYGDDWWKDCIKYDKEN